MRTRKITKTDVDEALRERMREIARKGGSSRSAAKVAAVKLNLERANAARKARKG